MHQREKVEMEMKENKLVMGRIAGRLTDARGA
jgi:hypothetical protein